jgi:hypothetical protein
VSQNQLGFAPIIPVIAKAVPAVVSLLSGKKKQKAAERAAQYEVSAQQIAEGRAVMATDVMTEADMAFLRKVWPSIRVAASFEHPNWAALGYPNGPALTPAAKAAITHAWPTVRVAASFDDVAWQYHAVPNEIVASLLPLPELGYRQPAVSATYPARFDQASAIPGLSNNTLMIAGMALAAGLIIFSKRR